MVVVTDPSQDVKNKSQQTKWTKTDNLEQRLNAGMVGIEWSDSKSIWEEIWDTVSGRKDRAFNAVSTFIKDKTQARGYDLDDAISIREEENRLNQIDTNLLSEQDKIDHYNRLYFLENKYKELWPKDIDVEKARNLADSVLKSPTYIRVKRDEIKSADPQTGLPDRKSTYKTKLLEWFQEDVYNWIDKRDRYISNDDWWMTVYNANDSTKVADSVIDTFLDRWLWYTLDHLAEYEDRIRQGKDYDQDAYRELKSQISNIRDFAIYATNNIEDTYDFDEVLRNYMDEWNTNPFVTINELWLMENSDVYHSRQLLLKDLQEDRKEHNWFWVINDVLGIGMSVAQSVWDNAFAEVNAWVEWIVSLASWEWAAEARRNMNNTYALFDNTQYRGIYDNLKLGDKDWESSWGKSFANNIVDAWPDFVNAFSSMPRLLGKTEKVVDLLENRLFWSKAADLVKKYDWWIKWFSAALKDISTTSDSWHIPFIVARSIIKDWIVDNIMANALMKWTAYREYSGTDLAFDVGSSILFDWMLMLLKIKNLPISKEGNILKAWLVKKAFNISEREWSWMSDDVKDELWRIATSMIDVANESNPRLKEIVDKTSKYVEKKYKTAEAGIEWIINSVNKRSNNILIWASKDPKRKQYVWQDNYWALTLKKWMSFNDMLTMRKDYDNKILQYYKKIIETWRWYTTEWKNWNYFKQMVEAYKEQSNVIDWIKSALQKFRNLKEEEKANSLSDIKMVTSKWEKEMFDIWKTKNNIRDAKNANEEYEQLQMFKFHIAEMKKMYIQASLERSRIVVRNTKREDLQWTSISTAWKRNAINWLRYWSATWWEVWSVSKLDKMWREFIMSDNININWEEYFNKIFNYIKGTLDDDMVDLLLYTDRKIYNNREQNMFNLLNTDYSERKFFSNPLEVAYFVWPKWVIESTVDPNVTLKYRYRWLNKSHTRAIFELISDDLELPPRFRFEITADWKMFISDINTFNDILWWNWSWVEFKSALSWKDWWPTPDFVTPNEWDEFIFDLTESTYLPSKEVDKAIDEQIAEEIDWFVEATTKEAEVENNPALTEIKETQDEAKEAVDDNVRKIQEADPEQDKVKWKTKIEKWVKQVLDNLKKEYWPYWEEWGSYKTEDLEWVNFNSYEEDVAAFPPLSSMIDWSTYQKLLNKYNGEWLDLAQKKSRFLWMANMLVGWKWVYVDWNWNITFTVAWWSVEKWVSKPFVRKNWHEDFDVYIWDKGTFVTYSAETKSSAEEKSFNKRRRWGPDSQSDKYMDIHVQEYENTWRWWRWVNRLKEDNPEEKILDAYVATGNKVQWLVVRWLNHDRTAWHVNWTITFIKDASKEDVDVIMKETLDVSSIDKVKSFFSNWLWDNKSLDWIDNSKTVQEIILEWEKRWLISNIDATPVWKLNELYDNLRWEAIELWAQKIAKKYDWNFTTEDISNALTPYYMVDRANISNLLNEFNSRYPSAVAWVEKWSPENYWLMTMVNKWSEFKERRWSSRNYRRKVSSLLHATDNELREAWITDSDLKEIAKYKLSPSTYRTKNISISLKNRLNKIADIKCKAIRDKINWFISLERETISIRDKWKKKTQELRDMWMRQPKESRALGREILSIATDYNNRINTLDKIISDIWLWDDIKWAQSSDNWWERYISSLEHMREWHQNFVDRNLHQIFWLPQKIPEEWFKATVDKVNIPQKAPAPTEEPKSVSEKFQIKVKEQTPDELPKDVKTPKVLSSLWFGSDVLWWAWVSSNINSSKFLRVVTTLKDFILNNWITDVLVRFWDPAWVVTTTAARLARLENPEISIHQYIRNKKSYEEGIERASLWWQAPLVWNSNSSINYSTLYKKERDEIIDNRIFEDMVMSSDYVFSFDWGNNFSDYTFIKDKAWATPISLHSKFGDWVNALKIYWEWDKFISNSPIENIDAIINKFNAEKPVESTTVGKDMRNRISEITDDTISIGENNEWIIPTKTTQSELDYIKAEAIKNWTFLKAPNWKPSNLSEDNWLQVRTKDFKDRFWDWENDPKNASKVVDENWEPLLVYHGGAKWIERFRLAASWKESNTWYWFYKDRKTWEEVPVDSNRAIFFSDKYWVSSYYATLYWYNEVKNTGRLVRWLLWAVVLDGRRDVLPNLKEVSNELWITPKEWAIRACDLLAIFNPEFNNIKKKLLDSWSKLTKEERKEIQDKIYEVVRTDKYKEMMNVDSTNTYWTINSLSESLRFVSEYNNPEWIKKLKNWEIPVMFDKWFKNMANKSSLWYIQRFWVEKLNTEDPMSMDWFSDIDIVYWQRTKDWPDLNLYIKWWKFNWRHIKDLSEPEIKEFLDLVQRVTKNELDYRKWQVISQYKENSQVYSAFLNIRNPFAHDYEWSWIWIWVWYKWDEKMPTWYINARQVNKAINEWYDWVVYENISDPYLANNYWVFNPDNIRFASQQATDDSILTRPWENIPSADTTKSIDDNSYEVVTDEWQKPATDILENATEVKDNEAQNIIVDDIVDQFAETKTVTPNYVDSLWESWRWEFSPWRVDELVKVKSWKIDKELEILPDVDTNGKFWIRSYAPRMNDLLKKDNLVSKDIQSKLIGYETSGKDFWDPDFELFLSCADVLALANWLPIYNCRFTYYKERYHLKDGMSRVTLLKNILNDVHKNYWIITITKDWKIFLTDKDNMIQKKYKEYGEILSWLASRIDYMSRGLNYESQIRYGNKNTEDLYNDIIVPEIQSLEKQIKDIEDSLEEVSKTAKRIKKGWKEVLQSTDMYNKLKQIEKLKKDIEELKQAKRWDIHILTKKYESVMKSIWDLTKEKYYDSTWNIITWRDQVSDSIWGTGKISYNTEKNPDFWIDAEDTGDAMHGSHRWPVDRGTDISSMQNEDDLMINPNWVEIKEFSGWKWEKTSPSFLKKYWIGDDDYIRMKRVVESDANKFEEKIISDWDYQWWANEDWLDIPRGAMDVFIKYAQRMARVNSTFKRISKNWVKIRDKFYWEWFWPMKNLTEEEQKSLSKFWPLRYWAIAWKNPVIFFTRESWNSTTIKKVLPTWYKQFVNAFVLTNTPEGALYSKPTVDLKKFLQLEKTSIQRYAMQEQDIDALLDSYYYDLNYDVSKLKWDDLKEQQEIIDKLKKYQDKANEIIDDMIKKWKWPKTESWKDVVLRWVLTELLVHNPPKIWSYELEIPESLIDYKFNWESNSLKWWRLPDKIYKNAIWFKQVSYALDSNMWVIDKSVMWELLNNLNNPNWWYVLIYWDNVNWISQIEKNLIDIWYEPVTNQSYDYAPIMNKEWYLYRPKKPSKKEFLKQAEEIEKEDKFIQDNSAQGCK